MAEIVMTGPEIRQNVALQPFAVHGQTAAQRFGVLPMPNLAWDETVAAETAHLYEKVKTVIPSVEWPFFAPYVKAINALKKERNAVILAHNYQTPEIFNCVADVVGDSLQLAREATKVKADIIIQCGVHFMAETSKLLNPEKTILIPDMKAAARWPPPSPGPMCVPCGRPIRVAPSWPMSIPQPT